jgi:hypothetical protein
VSTHRQATRRAGESTRVARSAQLLKTLTSPRLKPWRESPKFSQKPPFESLPANGACPCGGFNCRFIPELDGDWWNGHLWKFHGSKCHRHVFLNSAGVRVAAVRRPRWLDSVAFKLKKPPFSALPSPCPMCGKAECKPKPVPPVRERDGQYFWVFQGADCNRSYCLNAEGKCVGAAPSRNVVRRAVELRKVCSQCGRLRVMHKKFQPRLGYAVIALRCRSAQGDAPGRKHDSPELFREENRKCRPLTAEELDRLHGRDKRTLVVQCDLDGCPRHGRTMERFTTLHKRLTDGTPADLAGFRCRAPKPHVSYRVLPTGEVADRLGHGKYRWADSTTGQVRVTAPVRRPLRKNRIIPVANCSIHGCVLQQYSGPWRVRGKMRRWRAVCSVGREFWYVRSDGDARAAKASRWSQPSRGGRPRGISEETQERLRLVAAIMRLRRSLRSMAKYVFRDTPKSAESNTYRLVSEHREPIDYLTKTLTNAEAEAILQRAIRAA